MTPLEKITDFSIVILTMFIGTVLIFSEAFRSAGMLACEKQAHRFINTIETTRCITKKDYEKFTAGSSVLPGRVETYIFLKGQNDRFLAEKEIEKQLNLSQELVITEGDCIVVEIVYNRIPLYFCAFG